jgi:acyl-CoA thioesterase YciA
MELITRNLCMTKDLGVHGNLFGGIMMSWLDEAGAILAARTCKTKKMITLKFEEVVFTKPVKENHEVNIYGEVEKVGNTSITIRLSAKRYDVYDETEEEVCSTKVIFVRISHEGKKRPIDSDIREKFNKK